MELFTAYRYGNFRAGEPRLVHDVLVRVGDEVEFTFGGIFGEREFLMPMHPVHGFVHDIKDDQWFNTTKERFGFQVYTHLMHMVNDLKVIGR